MRGEDAEKPANRIRQYVKLGYNPVSLTLSDDRPKEAQWIL